METFFEQFLIYGSAGLLCFGVIFFYLRQQKRKSDIVMDKIAQAKKDGMYEPVSLHPVVNPNQCIQTGACISACPEHDILGIVNGKATTINASQCIGHGACFHACPTQAITLCIGTEKRGVELPHVNQNFETNIRGIYIAGELGGMGLIRNAVEQGRQAVDNIVKAGIGHHHADYDLVVIGAGPAGISATLNARKHGITCMTFEQDSLGGTVFTFPRSKVVMTSAMDLPLHGKVKLYETSKSALLALWTQVIEKHGIEIRENAKVESIARDNDHFTVTLDNGTTCTAKTVLLAIGRRGTPRKLGVPGETLEKVAYRLLDAEIITGKNIVVVGGGDSAVESALLLADRNKVLLSYRGEAFSRLKPRNRSLIEEAAAGGTVTVRLNTNLRQIGEEAVTLHDTVKQAEEIIPNDLVYIFAGGELPTQFLSKIGLQITTRYGEAVLKH